jgi:purine nucleosidase
VPDSKIPVLLDTDIGSDIDDAVALAYLLAQPKCELLGVTTVTGQAKLRAKLVDAIARVFGRDNLPIYAGQEEPFNIPQRQPDVPQAEVLSRWPHREPLETQQALDFLRDTIRSRPDRVVLLSIGPLTNIAKLVISDPRIAWLVKSYVLMGGVYFHQPPGYGPVEWNAGGDPQATATVCNAGFRDFRCVGLDVTTQCRLPTEEFRQRFQKGPLKIVGEMAETWFSHRKHVLFHDPLAAACIFEPQLIQFSRGTVRVELQDEQLAGRTILEADDAGPHQVGQSVDSQAFFKHYFSILEGI